MNSRSYWAVRGMRTPEGGPGRLWRPGTAGLSAVDAADDVDGVGGQCPPGAARGFGEAVDRSSGEPVEDAARRVGVALLDAGAGADDGLLAHPAPVADDGGGLDDAAAADVAALDHGAGPDDDVVLDDQLVVPQQVQYGVLQDLDA